MMPTMIHQGAAKGPNFAGHYTGESWRICTPIQRAISALLSQDEFDPELLSLGLTAHNLPDINVFRQKP
jgi:hypothetical protein